MSLIESRIWVIAVSKVLIDVDDTILIAGHTFGFASGTILRHYLENIMGIDIFVTGVFTSLHYPKVAEALR